MSATDNMITHWTTGEPASHQYAQQATAPATDSAGYNSPPDTPLAKIVQQQQQQGGGDASLGAQPTPPLSASSHGMGATHHQHHSQQPVTSNAATDAWRTYHASYHPHGIPVPGASPGAMPGSYAAGAPFGSPIQPGLSGTLDATATNAGGSFEHSATAEYYYNHGAPHSAHHIQQYHTSSVSSAPGVPAAVPSHHNHHAGSIGDINQHLHGYSATPVHSSGGHPHDAVAVSHFDHAAAAAAAAAAASGGPYMGDFGHNIYSNGAAPGSDVAGSATSDIGSTPASVMHLPPIDPTSGLSRQGSYFGIPAQTHTPGAPFDPVTAAAAAAAASPYGAPHSARNGSGPHHIHTPHGHHPYTSPMVLNRFNLSISGTAGSPTGAIPTPPPLSHSASAMGIGHSHGAASLAMESAPQSARPIPMARGNSHHGQTSTSQRKRYLCTVCQKMFARPSTLSTHMHSHTGEKPYVCTWDQCGKKFSVMSNLRRHQRIHDRQRNKIADIHQKQQQEERKQQRSRQSIGDGESTSGSTTPLAVHLQYSAGSSTAISGGAPSVGSPLDGAANGGHHMLHHPSSFMPQSLPPPPSHMYQNSPILDMHGSHQFSSSHQPMLHAPHPNSVSPSHMLANNGTHQMSLPSIGSSIVHDETDPSSLSAAAVAAAMTSDPSTVAGAAGNSDAYAVGVATASTDVPPHAHTGTPAHAETNGMIAPLHSQTGTAATSSSNTLNPSTPQNMSLKE
ncbi:hypothetical protein IW140_000606 [Coemansia sp. RSA 1813]|nr:hypothetical protein EV178_002663 [Coemansia sp. RSA 1646]KAJ1774075.1 hypothetical protein LPJ74_000174 [Coemansia sp. RSA 1843]KAJ2092534.1 hypothetical protein IW138_000972 [Coemansia sp. RSA 986]KAJ2216771.1 hypothetical protein EV179_001061 [Coemansia sp. RSA 487]KAJ2572843.1 hypothetical protein IW140_000606 [Coemansia sp. RSA 1813]